MVPKSPRSNAAGSFPTRLVPNWRPRAVRVHETERLGFRDELRVVKGLARRELAGATGRLKRQVAQVVDRALRDAAGPHGAGFMTSGSGFGGCRWFFRCGGCGGRAVQLYRPIGSENFRCRRCWGLTYSRHGRCDLGRLLDLEAQLVAYVGRPGRRPRRYWRAVVQLGLL
jgi:hypothetical protein